QTCALPIFEPADEGEIIHTNDYRIEYLPQQPQFVEEMTVLDYVFSGNAIMMQVLRDYELARIALEEDPMDETKQTKLMNMQQLMEKHEAREASTGAKTILTKMGITQLNKLTTTISGVQQKRVAIAKALIQPADLLILDEPTNHLDNETIVWLEKHLTTYQGALLLVTHDRYFLNHVTNTIFELDHGNLYKYEGNYELFL